MGVTDNTDSYQSNPAHYVEKYPEAIVDKDRAYEIALIADYQETRAANLRLGLRAILINGIKYDNDGNRYIEVYDDLEGDENVTEGMYTALMEDAAYSEGDYPNGLYHVAGREIFSVEFAISAIKEATTVADGIYNEGGDLLSELEATKR